MSDEKYIIETTLWSHSTGTAETTVNSIHESFESAMDRIEKLADKMLTKLNETDTAHPRPKMPVEDSDGNVIGHEYPFRADFTGEDHCIIRLWDDDDYRNVIAFNIYRPEDFKEEKLNRTVSVKELINMFDDKSTHVDICTPTVRVCEPIRSILAEENSTLLDLKVTDWRINRENILEIDT